MPTLTEDFKFLLDGNARFQQLVRETLPLCSDAEQRMLTELAGVVDKQLKEAQPQIAQLQGMFEADLAQAQADAKKDEAQIAELEARLQELKKKMAEPPPKPEVPPEPPLPGFGDPAYGRALADELLGLIGTAATTTPQKDLGDVWELMSSDWKIDEAKKPAPKSSPAPHPGAVKPEPRKDRPEDVWELQSKDWKEDESGD